MTKAIIVREFGGPEVLKLEDRSLARPAQGEVQVRHEAIGLNYIDVYHRTGLYKNPLPFTPGQEAAGVVTARGEGVTHLQVGDRIVYSGAIGAYSQMRNLPAESAIPLPENIDFETGAAVFLKGLTACFLLTMTTELKAGDTILLHAASGGVGQLAVQWAKSLGVRVIGTVGSDEKAEMATRNGADAVINIRTENFVSRVKELTDGKGVDVVYDSIGKDTFDASLDCLRNRGLMVSFGNASGPVSIPNLGILAAKGGLFVTRPVGANYFVNRQTTLEGANKLFKMLTSGALKINVGQRFNLAEIYNAHRALEARETVGATIIHP